MEEGGGFGAKEGGGGFKAGRGGGHLNAKWENEAREFCAKKKRTGFDSLPPPSSYGS